MNWDLAWYEWLGIIGMLWAAAGIALLMWWAAWIGHEPDVSGDPERDAGYSDEEIESMSEVWDRGSCRTAEDQSWNPSESAQLKGGHDV